MAFTREHKKLAIAIASFILILHLFVSTAVFSKQELLRYFLLIAVFYSLILLEIYQLGKMKRAITAAKHVSILSLVILVFTFIPVIAASVLGILPIDISLATAFETNIIFALCVASICKNTVGPNSNPVEYNNATKKQFTKNQR